MNSKRRKTIERVVELELIHSLLLLELGKAAEDDSFTRVEQFPSLIYSGVKVALSLTDIPFSSGTNLSPLSLKASQSSTQD